MAIWRLEARPQAPVVERIYVWELPVRWTHWVTALTLFFLSLTGFYIGTPIFQGDQNNLLMSQVRAWHRLAAYVFTASVLVRIYWAFVGNEWARGSVFFPYLRREGWQGLIATFKYYTFLRRNPPGGLGHNPLAAVTYSVVWSLMVVEILTGFAMVSLEKGGWWTTAFGWVFVLAAPQYVRLVHHLIMWLLLGFTVHHVYSAVLMDVEEKQGLISSIFSGYKFGHRPPETRTRPAGAGR